MLKTFILALALTGLAGTAHAAEVTVSHDAGAQYQTIQAAVDALPDTGGDIAIAPGTYREKLTITKNGVHLKGTGADPKDTLLVYGDCAATAGGTFKSYSVNASGDDFHATNLTIQNDCWLTPGAQKSQAVALALTGDRAVLTHVRLLGHQDTLYANKGPQGRMARQYLADCYIEGHVDFIFGNSKAYFHNCELRGLEHISVMYTAQSKNAPAEDSAYVFDHCKLTAEATAQGVSLGRAWRPYATVIFLYTDMEAPIIKGGWREWTPGKTNTLPFAYYAEYKSTGPGADPTGREPYSYQLTDKQAESWSLSNFFKGDIAWIPAQ
ncbi:MAG TPA: pectinesterase family protein [Asticcacaulis sp.]|nr:pectinesterase family protein [Asticcacaulis sp.]